jgi:hypothetical protein
MAIDKIKLRALAKDKDERLFEEGDMLDALNIVTSTSDGDDGGVVKNIKGTLPGIEFSDDDEVPSEKGRVIGSVSDDSRGHVYFFVWSTTASNHAIYQYDSKTNRYRVVLRNAVLEFEEHGFVKADLINGEFETDSTKQTILYFTDNVNPPRKINVDKFLANTFDVSLYSEEEIFEMISAAKTPVLLPPQVSLGTDDTRSENNLYGSTYQFSVQVKYKDGELSAISPHSEIIYPKYMAIQGVEQSATDLGALAQDNFIYVDTRWNSLPVDFSYYKEDVDEIKLLVRENNTGYFRLVDSFDPNEDLVRNGSTLYTTLDGVYRFYNNGVYTAVSVSETDKIYDDVPQKATSQAIVANRLMYSSPTSGYPNTDVSASLSVRYLPIPSATYAAGVDADGGDFSVTPYPLTLDPALGSIKVDYSSLDQNISAGSIITLEFDFKPSDINHSGYNAAAGDQALLKVKFGSTPYSDDVILYAGEANDSQGGDFEGSLDINLSTVNQANQNNARPGNINWERLRASVTLTETLSQTDAIELLVEEIEQQVLSYQYNSPSETMVWKLRDSEGSEAGKIEFSLFKFDLKFKVANLTASNEIILSPRIGNYFIPSGETSESTGFLQSPSISFYDEWDDIGSPTHTGNYSYFNGVEDALDPIFYSGIAFQRDGIWFNGTGTVDDYFFGYYSYGRNQITPVINGYREEALTVTPTDAIRTFKAGCDHAFGVVYFDRHGRPGFVNELGSVTVAPFGDIDEREDPDNAGTYFNGPCEISINLNGTPPDWAVAYQIVYSDMVTWEKFESYSVGGGFFESANDNHIDVSFNTLVEYQADKGAIKDYSFTPGDKLRVISYKPSVNESQVGDLDFPSDPTDYTFDVSDYITELTDIENPPTSNQTHTNHRGKFLSLAKPFGNNPPAFTPGVTPNLWENKCVVEILTPRKQETEMVYYEIGEARRIYKDTELTVSTNDRHNDGNPIVTSQGSVYYKPVSIFVPQWDGTDWQIESIDTFDYETRMLESSSVSDFVSSRSWSKGRAHVTYDRADTINYYNRIVYSEEMGDDIGGLTFSSFNPGTSSYKNLPKTHGSINHISNYNQSVAVLQENKLSYIPVERNVIEYADGASNLTVSNQVMGKHKESNGDFGCGNDQSAVLQRDGILFFVDRSRQKVLASVGGEMKAISDIEMSSFFEGEFDNLALADGNGGRIISGFDPMENMYYITIEEKEGTSSYYSGLTAGYSIPDKRWISKYSFIPTNYASIDNKMLSCKHSFYGTPGQDYLFHSHRGTGASEYNTFYGTSYPSSVKVVSKISPSNVKVFNAISYEGTLIEGTASHGKWFVPTQGVYSSYEGYTGPIEAESFKAKEGSYYAPIPRSVFNSGYTSSENILIGNLTHVSGGEYTSNINLRRIPIPINANIQVTGSNIPSVATIVTSVNGNTITFDDTSGDFDTSNDVYIVTDPAVNGNSIRGHWCTIRMNLPPDDATLREVELYCINVHLTDSKLHHPKGQQ